MTTRILIVDDAPLRQAFLNQLLDASGSVVDFQRPEDALAALQSGLPVDVAVLQYRRQTDTLIRELGQQNVPVLAFGSPRKMPAGVEQYVQEPVLGYEVREKVEAICRRRRRRQAAV